MPANIRLKKKHLPFLLFLAVFYSAWLTLILVGDHWQTVVSHWPMAAAMAVGSYVAGSTPMGGGTVGFPVLVLLLDLPAILGRDFSFAVQAVGMTSASVYILCSGKPLEWPMLRAALPGALVGTPPGYPVHCALHHRLVHQAVVRHHVVQLRHPSPCPHQ